MQHSFSGQLSVFLLDFAVLHHSAVSMCMSLLLFEQINDDRTKIIELTALSNNNCKLCKFKQIKTAVTTEM